LSVSVMNSFSIGVAPCLPEMRVPAKRKRPGKAAGPFSDIWSSAYLLT
jgi:hypothetical protein